jgi:hypothetical protein
MEVNWFMEEASLIATYLLEISYESFVGFIIYLPLFQPLRNDL